MFRNKIKKQNINGKIMKSNKSHKNTKVKRGRSNVPEFAGQTKQQTKQTKANRFDSNSDHKLVLGYKVTAVKSELESLEFTLEGYTGISTAIWRERKVDWLRVCSAIPEHC